MLSLLEYANKEIEHLERDGSKHNFTMTLLTMLGILERSEVFRNGDEEEKDALVGLFCRLANRQPISRLTGEQDEWQQVCHSDFAYVNKRCPRVVIFADDQGAAYDLEARAFTKDRGQTWLDTPYNCGKIEFPYRVPARPKRVYLDEKDTPEAWVKRNVKKGRILG